MKTKKQKNNFNKRMLLFSVVVFIISIIIFLILFLSIVKIIYETEKVYNSNYYKNIESVEISTDKNIYTIGEKNNLTIKNNEKQPIYFEPCEYLNNFEKKINGKWERENAVVNHSSNYYYYDQNNFNKNKSMTECEVELPKTGEGTYRFFVKIYYDCKKPGSDMCPSSKVFYSNEFEVKDAIAGRDC